MFADDTMFFTKANTRSCATLKRILEEYGNASGQQINSLKSSITFSARTPQETRDRIKQSLGIATEGGVGKYLRLPELFTRKKRDLFTSIVDRIKLKATSWSTRRLSPAGKLTMLKAVLAAIPTYSMSCFLLPLDLCDRIQAALTMFWWDSDATTRKICWIDWDSLPQPKQKGGLGFRDIREFNIAMLAKLAWIIIKRPDSLMSRILLGKYCHSSSLLEVSCSASASHGWRGIMMGCELIERHLGKAIGNGESTSAWTESWLSTSEHLRPYGPSLEEDSALVVADLLNREDASWNKEKVDLLFPEIAHIIYQIKPSRQQAEDSFLWQKTKTEEYSVKSDYYAIMEKNETATNRAPTPVGFSWKQHIWIVKTSEKLKLFLWKLSCGALPLGVNLQNRGIACGGQCPHCNAPETALHLFFSCPFAQQVWGLAPLHVAPDWSSLTTPVQALISPPHLTCLPPTGITSPVLPWILWNLWYARNLLVFEARPVPSTTILTNALMGARE
ncbi:PREDICTED: uncharacterized protein LOC106308921 [Brassica oleracea var. oleracea]|uniref:uncharacterized protein LOC106308921 n=1 Tax=Brassica oleracea var. oleracea TaxID=109376 RepID=UPI0006A6E1C0|nr:PREDICTED: uncharacterized protein LOC106308921 [Brassica oleracea var. oleracea]